MLTHSRPGQTLRLVHTLSAQFDHPPIVIHHDFGKCDLNVAEFPANVQFVRPHLNTGWGTSEVNDAFVLGLEALFRWDRAPKWFALLSGVDYPIKPATQILEDLNTDAYDLYIQNKVINRLDTDSFGHEMAHRYFIRGIKLWYIDYKLRLRCRPTGIPSLVSKLFLPWSKSFRCYSGLVWCSGNRKAAEAIMALHPSNSLKKHYRTTPCSDEFYIHSLACNQPGLRVSSDNKRYIDFRPGKPHPQTLRIDDIPAMVASGAHFARKFEQDDPVLDRLDEIIGISPATTSNMQPAPSSQK
ncbi:MAG: hypothetical protein M3O30_16855 [Planctomycetota bacterium]|nr:hypothetical protein [Planctomycetota bacterium]